MIPISKRNREILQMRKDGVLRNEVARRFNLSGNRIEQLEKRDTADRSMGDRRIQLLEKIREADDIDKMWPVTDLLDAVDPIGATKKRLMHHFLAIGQEQISVRELMDMCLDAPVEGLNCMMSPLLRVRGVGGRGFRSVVNGLSAMDLGIRSTAVELRLPTQAVRQILVHTLGTRLWLHARGNAS